MKIGVIADTHIPEAGPALPPALGRAFRGMDVILHAGDICTLEVLRELQDSYAITIAVHGEKDDAEVQRFLQPFQLVELGGRRILLAHGHHVFDRWGWRRRLMRPGAYDRWLQTALHTPHPEADVVIYGHTHRPAVRREEGILFCNPGAGAPIGGHRPSIAVLDISPAGVDAQILYLDEI